MPTAKTPSGSLHYELTGSGVQKVLLIMGFGSPGSYWDPIPQLLAHLPSHAVESDKRSAVELKSLEDKEILRDQLRAMKSPQQKKYQVCTFDTRGIAQSPLGNLLNPFTSSSQARDIVALLDHLGWIHKKDGSVKEPVPILHIVGWSMGGMIALELVSLLIAADIWEHKIASLVTLSSSGGGFRWYRSPILRWYHLFKLSSWIPVPVLRNFPPWSGFIVGMKAIFAFSQFSRVKNILRLHYDWPWLTKPSYLQEVWTSLMEKQAELSSEQTPSLGDEAHSPCDQPSCGLCLSRATQFQKIEPLNLSIQTPSEEEASIERSADSLLDEKEPKIASTNYRFLSQIYLQRAPFDSPMLASTMGLLGHLWTCTTHYISPSRFKNLQHSQSSIAPLVITGDVDRLVDPRNSFHLALMLQCGLVLVKKAGHMVHVERPWLIRKVLDHHFQCAAQKFQSDFLSPPTPVRPISSSASSQLYQLFTAQEIADLGPSPFFGVYSHLAKTLDYLPFLTLASYLLAMKFLQTHQRIAIFRFFIKSIRNFFIGFIVLKCFKDLIEGSWHSWRKNREPNKSHQPPPKSKIRVD